MRRILEAAAGALALRDLWVWGWAEVTAWETRAWRDDTDDEPRPSVLLW